MALGKERGERETKIPGIQRIHAESLRQRDWVVRAGRVAVFATCHSGQMMVRAYMCVLCQYLKPTAMAMWNVFDGPEVYEMQVSMWVRGVRHAPGETLALAAWS